MPLRQIQRGQHPGERRFKVLLLAWDDLVVHADGDHSVLISLKFMRPAKYAKRRESRKQSRRPAEPLKPLCSYWLFFLFAIFCVFRGHAVSLARAAILPVRRKQRLRLCRLLKTYGYAVACHRSSPRTLAPTKL